MKITKVIFEGTPVEFKEIAGIFMETSPGEGEIDTSVLKGEDGKPNLSVEDAYRALLKRRNIPNAQLQMFKVLADGELSYHEYLQRMERTTKEIAGVHGAFGRRINNTPEIHEAGLPGNMSAVAIWQNENGVDYLKLKDDFLAVLREEGII